MADLDLERKRPVAVPAEMLTTNVDDILKDPEIQIVIELIGGLKAAKTVIRSALENGKHVVTANKALLAHDGNELFELALKKGLSIGFEASVGGGIPHYQIRCGRGLPRTGSTPFSASSTARQIISSPG